MFFHLIKIVQTDLGGDEHKEVLGAVYITCAAFSSAFTLLIGYLFDRINPKVGISHLLRNFSSSLSREETSR